MQIRVITAAALVAFALSGCDFGQNDSSKDPQGSEGGGGGGGNENGGGGGGGGGTPGGGAERVAGFKVPNLTQQTPENSQEASCARKANLTGGRHHQVTLTSASGEVISFEVIEPKVIDCTVGNPLVLHGHGFGGSRTVNPAGTFLERLQNNGYAVISIDQRGFGQSTGTVRVMDPNAEGKDLLQILDWAEKNLDYLAHDTPDKVKYNLVAGATGGSYGGMYQLLIHNTDPKGRLDALTPDITPHDLRYSLNPGNTVKSAWVSLLSAGGETGASEKLVGGLDPVLKETLVRGVTTNVIHSGALPFFYYHSVRYFTDAKPANEQQPMSFLSAPLSSLLTYEVPAAKPKPVSILFSQGMRDTLFNFNDGWNNFKAYKAIGGDVRLMTHESGHILPGTQTVLAQTGPLGAGINQITAQLNSAGLSTVEIQKPGGPGKCGTLDRLDATVAFLNEKLDPPKKVASAPAVVSALDNLKTKVCLSLKDNEAVWVDINQIDDLNLVKNVTIPATTLPVPNSVLGITSLLQPTFIPLAGLPTDRRKVAGIGQLNITLSSVLPANGCAVSGSAPAELPVKGCDAIIYVGWGAKAGSAAPRLLDEQVVPIRGLGDHVVTMTGVADALADDEALGLLVYGYHLQYFSSISRDLLVPAVTVSGKANVPLIP